MKAFACSCGARIFFENSQCLACGSELGWCPACRSLRSLIQDDGRYRCGDAACGTALAKCANYEVEHVCNRCVPVSEHQPGALCDYCRFNETIPDLSVEGNRALWLRLEMAKRRLLYSLDLVGLPYGRAADGVTPPLSFDFKQDAVEGRRWWMMGEEERVFTGHANGKITINIREADPLEQEKTRTAFEEAHRTLIGHFRHEIGHYYWDMLVLGRCEGDFKAAFGDHENPAYADALRHYYDNGPPPGWQSSYVSKYATMHPWEDFAESFATYLDMVSVLDTAHNLEVGNSVDPRDASFADMLDRYVDLGVVLNEMNRAMGLIDLVPEVFSPAIAAKIEFVHRLAQGTAMRRQAENRS